MDEKNKSAEESINFLDKIKEFVTQEKDYVLQKYDVVENAYREALLTIQRVDEKRTPH